MKGKTLEDAVNATINHGVSMHGQNLKELQTPEKRAEIASKAVGRAGRSASERIGKDRIR